MKQSYTYIPAQTYNIHTYLEILARGAFGSFGLSVSVCLASAFKSTVALSTWIFMSMYVCTHVCMMYVRLYVCMYVCMYV